MFAALYPPLAALNVMGLASPQSAILSAIIFNALVIVALIPLALKGVTYRPSAPPRSCGAISSSTASAASSCPSPASRPSTSPSPPSISPEAYETQAMLAPLRPALVLLTAFTIITGLAYPLAMTGLAGAVFRPGPPAA